MRLGSVPLVRGLVLGCTLATLPTGAGSQQAPGMFRTRITVVPIDVRVVDRDGKPVLDLKQEDFTIVEEGVRQEIRHFAVHTLVSEAPGPADPTEKLMLRRAPGRDLEPQTRRTFLIVFGRGRLNAPAKAVDAAIRFVRERLLPQDHVAVLAFNRATNFTRDHEKIAQVLDRFKRRHEGIEAKLAHWQSGLAALYGSRDVPDWLQADINAIFDAPGAPATRTVEPGTGGAIAGAATADQRRATDLLQRADALPHGSDKDALWTSIDQLLTEAFTDLPLEQFVSRNTETLQDLGRIQAGIEYLRYLEGEKHLVFLTERGLFLPRGDDDRSLAALAADARVVIDSIQTGGLPSATMTLNDRAVPIPGPTFTERFATMSLKHVSELTGGQSSTYDFVEPALRRIDQVTRAGYLLGYYPTNTDWNDKYRRITVRVNRPGVTVLYRHGYYASEIFLPLDQRSFLMYRRVAVAASYDREIADLGVRADASIVRDQSKAARGVAVRLALDVSKIAFKDVDGRHVATIALTFFCSDSRERLVGERWQEMNLALTDETYRKLLADGASHTTTVDVEGEPRYLKVVAYTYETDLVGTAIVKLRK